jgi:hypothetical protein
VVQEMAGNLGTARLQFYYVTSAGVAECTQVALINFPSRAPKNFVKRRYMGPSSIFVVDIGAPTASSPSVVDTLITLEYQQVAS